jgi:MFS family permease
MLPTLCLCTVLLPHACSPIILMIWLGFAYAMGAASLWPILSHIIPKKMLGTAYGTMTSVQNLGLALAPQLLGFIQDSYSDPYNPLRYSMPIFFFILCALTSFILCCILMYVDLKVTAGMYLGIRVWLW